MIECNLTPTKTYDTIKLGIDAHAKWYSCGSRCPFFVKTTKGRPGLVGVQIVSGEIIILDFDFLNYNGDSLQEIRSVLHQAGLMNQTFATNTGEMDGLVARG